MPKESKHDTFRRLAAQRTNTVLERLRILGNCANTQLYDYSEADVRKIFASIRSELRTVEAKFKNSHKPDFQL